jgi:hypothetical protein
LRELRLEKTKRNSAPRGKSHLVENGPIYGPFMHRLYALQILLAYIEYTRGTLDVLIARFNQIYTASIFTVKMI